MLLIPIAPKTMALHPYALAGNVADMSATCWPDSQMSALLADHKTDPDTAFSCRGWPAFTPLVHTYAQHAKNHNTQQPT
jgi:hypothetical protein